MKPASYFSTAAQIDLAQAISTGDLQGIDTALINGADINKIGKEEMTPLAWAFSKQKITSFERLLEKGANPNFKTKKVGWNNGGSSVMQFAALAEDPDYLKLTLKHGGDVNAPDLLPGKTIIYTAIRNRRRDNILILAQSGANLNHIDASGATPAMAASRDTQYNLVYLLMSLGADMSIRQIFKDSNGKIHRGLTLAEQIQNTGDRSIRVLGKEKEQREWYNKVVSRLERQGLM